MRASFQFTCDPPVARLRISGELDLSTSDDLEDALEGLETAGCTLIELDLDALTFIDAYSLSLLRQEQRRLRMAGGDLRVVAASTWYTAVCATAEYDTLQPVSTDPPRLTVLRTRPELDAEPGSDRA
jgi:anti-anti-sigma factor